jgi:transcriptional regulator with PAS, ATPase and Fis domain
VTESVKKRANDFSDFLSVEPQPSNEVQTPDDEDVMEEALQNFKPKRKMGRPVGASDLSVRKVLDEDERKREIEKAKALRKDGWAFSRIAKELNVSQATATRWIRS